MIYYDLISPRTLYFSLSEEGGGETAGPWCPGREPYLGGSVNMDAMRREMLILIFKTDALYLNG